MWFFPSCVPIKTSHEAGAYNAALIFNVVVFGVKTGRKRVEKEPCGCLREAEIGARCKLFPGCGKAQAVDAFCNTSWKTALKSWWFLFAAIGRLYGVDGWSMVGG